MLDAWAQLPYKLWDMIWYVVYTIWTYIAVVIDILEDIFHMLAGVDPLGGGVNTNQSGAFAPDIGGTQNLDIVSLLINSGPVQRVFMNLIIVAIVLLMFFTVLQIIRENYMKKDGGNPYMIVFRMFKGMFIMLFITAVVVVGIRVSGIVLTALNDATGRRDGVGVSGVIFGAASYNANRLRLDGPQGPLGNDGSSLARKEKWDEIPKPPGNYNNNTNELAARNTSTSAYYGKPVLQIKTESMSTVKNSWWKPRLSTVPGAAYEVENNNSFYENQYAQGVNAAQINMETYVFNFVPVGSTNWWPFSSDAWGYVQNSQVTSNNVGYVWFGGNWENPSDNYWVTPANDFTRSTNSAGIRKPKFTFSEPDNGFDGNTKEKAQNAWTEMINSVMEVHEWFKSLPNNSQYKGSTPNVTAISKSKFEATIKEWGEEWYGVEVKEGPRKGEMEGGRVRILTTQGLAGGAEIVTSFEVTIPRIVNPSLLLKQFDLVAPSFAFEKGDGVMINGQKTNNDINGDLTTSVIFTPDNIDRCMSMKPFKGQVYYLIRRERARSTVISSNTVQWNVVTLGGDSTPMTYRNQKAVEALYDMSDIQYIILFGGIFIVLGVFLNFAFGLVQRLMELVMLYILSPIPLSMFPIDDGKQFKDQFVMPFYKKVIAVYGVILSLNLFFLIYPVFQSFRFFPESSSRGLWAETASFKAGNLIMSAFMTVALVALLPKIRKTIDSMFGTEGIEEKSLTDMGKAAWKELSKGGAQVLDAAAGIYKYGQRAGDRYAEGASERQAKWVADKMKKDGITEAEAKKAYGDRFMAKLGKAATWGARGAAAVATGGMSLAAEGALIAGKKLAASEYWQRSLGGSLLRAGFDLDNGVFMQGKLGKGIKETFGAKEKQARRDKQKKDFEERGKVRTKALAQNYKAAFLNSKSANEAMGCLRAMGITEYTMADLMDPNKTAQIRARVAAVGANSKTDLGKMIGSIDSRHLWSKDASSADIAKARAAIEAGDFDSIDENVFKDKEKIKAARNGDLAALVPNASKDDIAKVSKLSSAIYGAGSFDAAHKGFQDNLDKVRNYSGLSEHDLGQMFEAQSMAHGVLSHGLSEQEKAAAAKRYNNYVKNMGTGLADFKDSEDFKERLDGMYVSAAGGELAKEIGTTLLRMNAGNRDAIMDNKDVMAANQKGQWSKVQKACYLMSIGDWDSPENIFKDDENMRKKFSTPGGRKDAATMAEIYGTFGRDGEMTGSDITNAENALGYVTKVSFTKQCMDRAEKNVDKYTSQRGSAEDSLKLNAQNVQDQFSSISEGINKFDPAMIDRINALLTSQNFNSSEDYAAIEKEMSKLSELINDPVKTAKLGINMDSLREAHQTLKEERRSRKNFMDAEHELTIHSAAYTGYREQYGKQIGIMEGQSKGGS